MVVPKRGQSVFLVGAVRDHTKPFTKANETKTNNLSGLRDHLAT